MIVLVWSLVSSVVELNRRRRLAEFLREFFSDPANNATMLVCRRKREAGRESLASSHSDFPSTSNGIGGLSRFTSEPHLAARSKVIYRNEKAEVAVEEVISLHPSEWRFVPSLASEELVNTVFFVIVAGRNEESPADQLPACSVFLESSCERVAWHRLHPSSIYRCSLDTFTNVVYAFSEGALFENSTVAVVDNIYTVTRPGDVPLSIEDVTPSASLASSTSQLSQKAMPLLQQLFWGDSEALKAAKQRFASETVLTKSNGGAVIGQFGSLPRRLHCSPRRRFRSCNYDSPRHRPSPPLTQSLYCDIPLQTAVFWDSASQLPPYIRILDQKFADGPVSLPNSCLSRRLKGSEKTDMSSQGSISPSITIDELTDLNANQRSDDELGDIPYADDISSPQPMVETSAYAVVISRKKNVNFEDPSPRNDEQSEDIAYMDEQTPSCSTPPPLPPPYDKNGHNGALKENGHPENGDISKENVPTIHEPENLTVENHPNPPNEENLAEKGPQPQVGCDANGWRIPEIKKKSAKILMPATKKPPVPMKINPAVKNEAQKIVEAAAKVSSFRRHSVMLMTSDNETLYSGNVRHRSLSPSPFDDYCRQQSMKRRASRDVSTFTRDSLRRPYTPTRNFLSSKATSSAPAMSKPQSILVYTAGKQDLYTRIRDRLSKVIPRDVYTVFNISADALRAQPWIESTTTCLIVAETSGLDDSSWAKMQSYFNQSGKIIFVCQNELLSSLTSSDSSKKKSNILKVAFGKKDSFSMNKDFEQFLKKSLKCLEKGQVNESFRSKDLASGTSYTVVLKKDKDRPLFLYMENSAHQASAIFSDATTDQLLADGSKILPESLSRIGVAVSNNCLPSYVSGILCAENDTVLDSVRGLRYGVEIGLNPKLFLRTEEMLALERLPSASEKLLPIQVGLRNYSSYPEFDFGRYHGILKTAQFGKLCLHVPITTTTMDVCDSLNDAIPSADDGITVVSGLQTAGRGRGGNEFISPRGACMFTFSFRLPKSLSLSSNPSFVQHVFAVSLVDAINTLSGIEDFPVKIKWPNDFYFNRSHKIGGMLATAKSRDDSLLITIGAGINVSNSLPTLCLNDIVPEGSGIHFHIEEIVAETLNRFEYWVRTYETNKSEFLNKYYEYWLHSREEVFVEELGEKVVIRGLDKYGYLEVRSKSNPSKLFSVGDDGNTFDMMKGLIRHKI